MADIIQLRRGSEALWTSTNPILAQGEQGYETDTGKRKIGNGVDPWNDLPYDGAGTGTVTSVAVSGSDGIEVDSGSPITSSGTIAIGINASALSTHLGLGTAATTAASAYATATQGTDERVPTAAGLTSKFGTNKASIADGDKFGMLDSAATDAPKHTLWSLIKSTLKTYFDTLYSATGHTHGQLHDAVTLAGTPDYITISGQVLTRGPIDLAADVTGVLPHGNLGTGGGGSTKFLREDGTYQTISGGGDALVASTLDQFADVTQTGGATLAINASTTLGGGSHSGTNTGDNATNSQYSGLVSNATHTGDVTGSTALTLATVNSNVGSFGSATAAPSITVNAKGLVTAASSSTITPAIGSITGLGTGVATALAVNVGSAGAPVVLNGALGTPASGTLTNCTGLPTAGITDDAVTLAKMASGTAGNLITYDASGNPAAVATGTSGHALTSNGAGAPPTFQAAAPYWVEVVLTAAGAAIASGTKVAMMTHMQAGTITGFKIVCDPANEPSAAAVQVDMNAIDLSTGAATSRLSSVASIATGVNVSTGGAISGTQTVAVGDQSSFDIDQGSDGKELRALVQITPS